MSDKVREQILAVRDTGLTNMFDINTVQRIAFDAEYYELVNYLEENRKNGLLKEDFDRIKRASYASYIKVFDSTKLAGEFTHMIHDDCDPFAFEEALKAVTFEEVNALFETLFKDDRYAMSIVKPLSE